MQITAAPEDAKTMISTSPESQKILIVDDEQDILDSIEFRLKQAGYQVLSCKDGKRALQMVQEENPNLVILDVMLPGMNGFDVCKELRLAGIRTPIIMLTAKTTEIDAVLGLELGADDYITKPARIEELMARVRTRLRNQPPTDSPSESQDEGIIEVGVLKIDGVSHTVQFRGNDIDLTQREFDLLKRMASSPNRVFSREQLLEEVWGWSFIGESRTVDVHIRYLREKLEVDPANPEIIKTVRGIGYKLIPPNA